MDIALQAHLSLHREVGKEAEVVDASPLVEVKVVLETLRLYVDLKIWTWRRCSLQSSLSIVSALLTAPSLKLTDRFYTRKYPGWPRKFQPSFLPKMYNIGQ